METINPPNQLLETWQVEANGQVYETTIEEMVEWIAEGSLLPLDKVRRGNLRWIEAQKVPVLHTFFNAKELDAKMPTISTTIATTAKPQHNFVEQLQPEYLNLNELEKTKECLMHEQETAKFVCETCSNYFCAKCPQSYSEKVKFCPMCGAMLKSITEAKAIAEKNTSIQVSAKEGFGLIHFGRAFIYPFKFPVSLIFGGLMFSVFSIGTQATALGGYWLIAAAIFSAMLSNMLVFGILSNTVENMLQGNLNKNFMPSFDDFTLWDDVIEPFFLSIGVYLSTFAPLILLLILLFFGYIGTAKTDSDLIQKYAVSTLLPDQKSNFGAAQNANKQMEFVREALKQQDQNRQRQMEAVQNRQQSDTVYIEVSESGEVKTSEVKPYQAPVLDEEKEFQAAEEFIKQAQKKQLESAIGQTPVNSGSTFDNLIASAQNSGQTIFILSGLFLFWGLFYLPIAYIVAAYTRNLTSIFNPLIGLDTIKRLGFDYVKILLMGLVLVFFSVVTNSVIHSIFSQFDLPKVGNIPALAVGSLFTFYFSIVFSLILGYALFKNSNNFQMYQNR